MGFETEDVWVVGVMFFGRECYGRDEEMNGEEIRGGRWAGFTEWKF